MKVNQVVPGENKLFSFRRIFIYRSKKKFPDQKRLLKFSTMIFALSSLSLQLAGTKLPLPFHKTVYPILWASNGGTKTHNFGMGRWKFVPLSSVQYLSSFRPGRGNRFGEMGVTTTPRGTTSGSSSLSSTASPPVVDEISSDIVNDMRDLFLQIKSELGGRDPDLCTVADYYFDGQGKAIRPMIAITMARAVNVHLTGKSFLLPEQKRLALAMEMIHTATLVHDDVIDRSNKRRGKPSVNVAFGERRTILSGDYILAKAGAMVARLGSDEMIEILAQILEDLVHGEFMQLDPGLENSDRFSEYIRKTFNKTASLMANSCKGVAVLGGCEDPLKEHAFQYGKHLGIAFQVVDDLLDFVASTGEMGKPVVADLQLGLATAPVLFAAEEFPELKPLVQRKFSEDGDVPKALELVKMSDGLAKTRNLAERHCAEARRYANLLKPSIYRNDLLVLTERVLNRSK